MPEKSGLSWIAFVLVIIGGLNWGLVGLFQLDLVALTLSAVPMLQRAVYILVGLSALWVVINTMRK